MQIQGVIAIAGAALLLGWIFKSRRVFPVAVVPLFLVAGLGLAGVIGNLLTSLGGGITRATDTGTASLIGGAGVPALAALGLTAVLVIDLMPSKSTSGWAHWNALIVPSVWAAVGGTWAQLDTGGRNLIAEAGTGMSTFFEQLVVGW